jgi:adenylate cyclase
MTPQNHPDRLLGWAYYQTGRYEEAIAAEKQVLQHNPHYLFAASFLVTSSLEVWLAQQERDPRTPERALEAAQQVVAVNDSAAVAYIVLGWASVLNKQYAQAATAIERALALNPAIASIFPPLVTGILNYAGRPDEVLKLMEQVLRLIPTPPARYFMQLGHAYYLTGRTEEAIEPLQRFLNVSPHRVDAHVLLAAAYSEVGREDEARAEAAEVLRLSPQYSLDVMQQRWPYKDPVQLERLLVALRKAGLK